MEQKIYLKNDVLFANEFVRVVHGGRGDYVEFYEEQILCPLISRFGNDIQNERTSEHYYYWLYPESYRNTKVYLQLKTVKYADYKIGMLYVAPNEFKDFRDPEKLDF